MAHTNRGRVILGGLLAGLVINIVEFITNGVVLSEAWGDAGAGQARTALSGRDRDFQHLGVPDGHRCCLALCGHPTALWCGPKDRNPRSPSHWVPCFSLILATIPWVFSPPGCW
jgi:hypothetical protein